MKLIGLISRYVNICKSFVVPNKCYVIFKDNSEYYEVKNDTIENFTGIPQSCLRSLISKPSPFILSQREHKPNIFIDTRYLVSINLLSINDKHIGFLLLMLDDKEVFLHQYNKIKHLVKIISLLFDIKYFDTQFNLMKEQLTFITKNIVIESILQNITILKELIDINSNEKYIEIYHNTIKLLTSINDSYEIITLTSDNLSFDHKE
jgi:hypothetical protein